MPAWETSAALAFDGSGGSTLSSDAAFRPNPTLTVATDLTGGFLCGIHRSAELSENVQANYGSALAESATRNSHGAFFIDSLRTVT